MFLGGEGGVHIFWFRPAGTLRSRIVVPLGCSIGVLGLLVYFWSDLCLWRADAQLIERKHEAAARWIEQSLWFRRRIDPGTCLLQLRVARRRQDFREVERKLQEAVQLGALRPEVERERWLAQAQTNQFAAMEEHWPQLLGDQRDDGPEIARAYYNWSMLHHNLAQAEKTLRLWHEDYPRDAEPLALTGRFYEAMVNWEGAEDAYRRASAQAPGNDDYRLSLANALQVRLKTKEAIPIYQEYLSRHPGDVVALQKLAQCVASDGDLEAAIQLLRKAMQANPDDFTTQKAYGEMLLSAGDASAAVPVLEKAYRTVPEHANLANSLARALKECGRTAEAKPLFAFVAESRPQLDQLLGLEKQLRREPENLELRMKIASLTATYVSRHDAIRWYETLLQIAPHYGPAHGALADLYQLTGDVKLAEHHARYVLQSTQSTNASVTGSTQRSVPSGEAPSDAR